MPAKTNTTINNNAYYRVTATIGHHSDGAPIRKQFYGTSKKDAEAKRDEYIQQLNKGLSVNFDKALFEHAFKAWMETVLKPAVALSSYSRYDADYRARIKGCSLSGMKLVDIKAIHVQAYYNGLLERYTVNTVRLVHKLLNSFFNYCIKADLIVKSPLGAVELPKNKTVSETNKAISDSDIQKLREVVKDDFGAFLFVFAVFTGLRQGEALALTHKDVDFNSNTITVNKSVQHLMVDGTYTAILSDTKTRSSVREVPILDAIREPLKAHIRREKEKHLRLGVPFSPNSILFSSSAGTYREPSNVRRALTRLCNRVGIERTTFHSLRHTFCTILAKQGVPLKTASVLMGHSDISLTAQIYTHVDNVELKKGIERLSVYFD